MRRVAFWYFGTIIVTMVLTMAVFAAAHWVAGGAP